MEQPTWLVGDWRIGRGGALCQALQIRIDDAGRVSGAASGNIDASPDALASWTLDVSGDATRLVASFRDGRTAAYAYVPSRNQEWDFVNPEAPFVRRVDLAQEGDELLVRLVGRDGSMSQFRYHRDEQHGCGDLQP
ncbi:MAG TPA: hypothetical protein VG939_14555 [Caulobacteraceae bacterium]|nr:hypothetical protein [Caulobacteraceae bacterium]